MTKFSIERENKKFWSNLIIFLQKLIIFHYFLTKWQILIDWRNCIFLLPINRIRRNDKWWRKFNKKLWFRVEIEKISFYRTISWNGILWQDSRISWRGIASGEFIDPNLNERHLSELRTSFSTKWHILRTFAYFFIRDGLRMAFTKFDLNERFLWKIYHFR